MKKQLYGGLGLTLFGLLVIVVEGFGFSTFNMWGMTSGFIMFISGQIYVLHLDGKMTKEVKNE